MEALRLSGAPGAGGKVVVPYDPPPTDFQRNVKRLERGYFLTCNAFYRRSVLEAVDGFDERFRAPYREDSDLCFRVEEAAGPMVTTDKAVVIHPAPRGRFCVSLRLQRYSMYNALIYRKHRRRSCRELKLGPPLHYYAMVLLAIATLCALVAGNFRLGLIFLLPWFALEAWFFFKRAAGTSREPLHLLDLALTSVLIPPLSIYWRLRGAIRFRVLFI
jgi:GT2 family glycosyltransferase